MLSGRFSWLSALGQLHVRRRYVMVSPSIITPATDNAWVSVDQHYCCARVCLAIDDINATGISVTDRCCLFRNGVVCRTQDGTPIAFILSVILKGRLVDVL